MKKLLLIAILFVAITSGYLTIGCETNPETDTPDIPATIQTEFEDIKESVSVIVPEILNFTDSAIDGANTVHGIVEEVRNSTNQ